MMSLLLLPLIAVLGVVNSLDVPEVPGGVDFTSDEDITWDEMDLSGTNEPQIYITPNGPEFEENSPLQGYQGPNLEDSKGLFETVLRSTSNTTTAQPSGDCESNGGECKKNKKQCKGNIDKDLTCSNNGVCCKVEGEATGGATGASEVTLQMLSNAILMQGMALRSMKINQEKAMKELNNTISKRGLAFQIMKKTISDAISYQGIALQIVKSNLSDTISNQGMAIQINQDTIMSNLSDGFSNKDNMLQIMGDNQDTIMSNLTQLGCPDGFFMLSPSNQCFKYINDHFRNWTEANSICQSEGLVMAKPSDPLILRSYLLNKYGYLNGEWPQVWLAARGTGSNFKWQPNGGLIYSSNPYWYSYSSSHDETSYCMYMLNTESNMKSQPLKPYFMTPCSGRWLYTICELVKE